MIELTLAISIPHCTPLPPASLSHPHTAHQRPANTRCSPIPYAEISPLHSPTARRPSPSSPCAAPASFSTRRPVGYPWTADGAAAAERRLGGGSRPPARPRSGSGGWRASPAGGAHLRRVATSLAADPSSWRWIRPPRGGSGLVTVDPAGGGLLRPHLPETRSAKTMDDLYPSVYAVGGTRQAAAHGGRGLGGRSGTTGRRLDLHRRRRRLLLLQSALGMAAMAPADQFFHQFDHHISWSAVLDVATAIG